MTAKKEAREARRARLASGRAAAADPLDAVEPASRRPRISGISRRKPLAALALALMVILGFGPAYLAEFVWDDGVFTDEPLVKSASGLAKIWGSPGEMKIEAHYWPVTYTTFWLEHKLWGLNPLGYHIVNVLLHLANVLLLWRLLGRLSVPGAWIVAAAFAVHPLHVESVAWVIERKDVLSGLFYLTSFLAYVRFVESRSRGPYLLALALFVAGLLSKTVVVTLPAALVIWHWWQRGRIATKDLVRTAPFFAIGLAIAFADTAFYRTQEVLSLDYSLVERILIAARALCFYAGKLLWPTDLAVIYPLWEIEARDPLAWAFVALAVALPAALWLGRNRWGRGPLACVAFFAVTLSPVLGLIDYGYMQFAFVADRFQYLAGIGLLTLLVAALVRGADRLPAAGMTSAKIVFAAVLALLGTLTWRQAANFRDNVTLFSHIASVNPEARDVHLNLAQALIKAGRQEESLRASRIAVEQSPDPAGAQTNLGVALMNLERFKEADGAFGRTLETSPRHLEANQNLAESMKRQGRYDETVEQFRRVLQIDENYALAWSGLGQALQALGRLEEAASQFERALELDPRDTIALDHLAFIRFNESRHEEALGLYRALLDTDGDNATAHANMGITLLNLGRYAEAVQGLERSLALDPEQPTAQGALEEARRRARAGEP